MHREMTKQEEAWLAEKCAGDPLIAAYLNNQVNAGQNFMQQAGKLTVCSKCERAALANGIGYICDNCGHIGMVRNMRVREYLKGGYWK